MKIIKLFIEIKFYKLKTINNHKYNNFINNDKNKNNLFVDNFIRNIDNFIVTKYFSIQTFLHGCKALQIFNILHLESIFGIVIN